MSGPTKHWAVSVSRNGENVVTIESACLSGRELSEEDERVIVMAAEHLLSFVGESRYIEPIGCEWHGCEMSAIYEAWFRGGGMVRRLNVCSEHVKESIGAKEKADAKS